MRVIHVSNTDVGGGAARGSYALHRAMVELGIDSHVVVERKLTDDPRVHGDDRRGARIINGARRELDQLPLRAYPKRHPFIFSPNRIPSGVSGRVRDLEPDVVHLHWVGASFVRPEDIPRFGVPVVWTLRDLWAFTGGCHYSRGCVRYQVACGECPHLGSKRDNDLSRSVWNRKHRSWANTSITPVAISQWMADRAMESSLFAGSDVHTISNAIDTEFWAPEVEQPSEGTTGRKRVLFVALSIDDYHKGFRYFAEACRQLDESTPSTDFEVIVVGESQSSQPSQLGKATTYLGLINSDEELRRIYRSAAVTVVPSTEEAFGKTAAESIACGTPVVCFSGTGVADVVVHGDTGFHARHSDAVDLARWIGTVLEDSEADAMRSSARAAAIESFSVQTAANRYVELYDKIIRA